MDAVRCVIDAAHIVRRTRPVSVLHGTSMSLRIPSRSRNFYSRSHSSQPVVKRCVYDMGTRTCNPHLFQYPACHGTSLCRKWYGK